MIKKNKSSICVLLFILTVWGIPFVSSCGKASVGPGGSNILYQVINLSPDLQPTDLYINFVKYNSYPFYYPTSSNYFAITTTDTPFQIRAATSTIPGVITSNANILNLDNILKSNQQYTLFITGLKSNNTISHIFLTDAAPSPTIGRGKIRFINASPGSQGLDVIANGVLAFQNAQYQQVSPFLELPAGNYNFTIYPTGSTNNQIEAVPGFTILDGRLYNFYCYGLPGHTTDSLAFGANILIIPQTVTK